MCNFLISLLILLLLPGSGFGQEVVRTSRYERTDTATKSSDKIEILRERHRIPLHCAIISPSSGDEIMLAVYRYNLGEAGETVIRSENAPFLFTDETLVGYYLLFNREPVIIGAHAYSFDAQGENYKVNYIKKESVLTKSIAPNEGFITQDGYIIRKQNNNE